MVTRHRARFLVAGLLALLFVLPAAAALAAPRFEREEYDVTEPVEACGATISWHEEGFVLAQEDANGARFSVHGKGSLSNPATGQSLSYVVAATEKRTFNSDGSTTVAILGLQGRVTVPGTGLMAADVGRLVLRVPAGGGEPERLFEAGQQGGGPFPALCPYLT